MHTNFGVAGIKYKPMVTFKIIILLVISCQLESLGMLRLKQNVQFYIDNFFTKKSITNINSLPINHVHCMYTNSLLK